MDLKLQRKRLRRVPATTADDRRRPEILASSLTWIIALIVLNLGLGGGLLMPVTFEWLNASMKLQQPSTVAQFITNFFKAIIPHAIVSQTKNTPSGVIFALFILGTFLFSTALVCWLMSNQIQPRQKTLLLRWAGISLGVWILARASAEEIFLVFTPLSVSLGMAMLSAMDIRESSLQRAREKDEVGSI